MTPAFIKMNGLGNDFVIVTDLVPPRAARPCAPSPTGVSG